MDREPLVIWTVYARQQQDFAARKFLVGNGEYKATEVVIVRPTLDALRAALPAGLYCIPRLPGDEPEIVECWL